MKIKFNSDNDLPLNRPLRFYAMTIIIRSVFEEGGNFIRKFFQMTLCMNYKNATVQKNDVPERIDTSKTSTSKECMLCHYWYFNDVGFKFEPHVSNKCHNVLMTAYELKNIAKLNVKGVDFRCIF